MIQHNVNYVVQLQFCESFLYYQPHCFHALAVFCAGADDIDARCVYTAMTENVSELGDILFDAVKYPCEQVAQVVRKDLVRIDIGFLAQ